MTDYVGAIDGGGTKTAGALADRAGKVHLTPIEAGCNPFDSNDWDTVLLRTIGHFEIFAPEISKYTFGLPGFGEIPAHDTATRDLIAKTSLAKKSRILNDVEMAFHGAFPALDGVLILAGTGSMAISHGSQGIVRIGGWGDVFGDEGGAYWIGQRALAIASKASDGRIEAPDFLKILQSVLGVESSSNPFALMEWLTNQPHRRSAIAEIARHIDAMATQGNAHAIRIMTEAATELSQLGLTATRRAGMDGSIRWSHAGSVFNSELIRTEVATNLNANPVSPSLNPLGGGLYLAAMAAGWDVDEDWIDQIRKGTS